jgi:hypothetical protein
LPSEATLNEADIHHGHRRVFDPVLLRRCIREAGLAVENCRRVIAEAALQSPDRGVVDAGDGEAFMQLGERLPDIAGEIYVIARRSGK